MEVTEAELVDEAVELEAADAAAEAEVDVADAG